MISANMAFLRASSFVAGAALPILLRLPRGLTA